jgi:hypothetical protein
VIERFILAAHRQLSDDHLPQQHAHCVQIAASVDRLIGQRLR